jgi:hypothetical protein
MIMHDDGMTPPAIVSTGRYQTQLVPAKTSHILHLVLTLFTFGLWSPVWFIVWLYNHNRSVQRQVWQNPSGFVYVQPHVYNSRAPIFPGWRWCDTHATWEVTDGKSDQVP